MKNKLIIILCLCLGACVNTKLQAIKGKTEADILKEKGNPMTKIHEGNKSMWTYRDGSCTEIIFFDDNEGVADLHELGKCSIPE